MTDFPTALTIIQRKADSEELWKVLHDTVEACATERTHIKPYLGVIYDDFKTIWNALAGLVDVKIDAGWFR